MIVISSIALSVSLCLSLVTIVISPLQSSVRCTRSYTYTLFLNPILFYPILPYLILSSSISLQHRHCHLSNQPRHEARVSGIRSRSLRRDEDIRGHCVRIRAVPVLQGGPHPRCHHGGAGETASCREGARHSQVRQTSAIQRSLTFEALNMRLTRLVLSLSLSLSTICPRLDRIVVKVYEAVRRIVPYVSHLSLLSVLDYF